MALLSTAKACLKSRQNGEVFSKFPTCRMLCKFVASEHDAEFGDLTISFLHVGWPKSLSKVDTFTVQISPAPSAVQLYFSHHKHVLITMRFATAQPSVHACRLWPVS